MVWSGGIIGILRRAMRKMVPTVGGVRRGKFDLRIGTARS
jgi:hypothetical protein